MPKSYRSVLTLAKVNVWITQYCSQIERLDAPKYGV